MKKYVNKYHTGHHLYRLLPDWIYHLTLQTSGNGTLTAPVTGATAGTNVTLTATPAQDNYFVGYNITGSNLTGDTFTFHNEDVTAKANFKWNGATPGDGYRYDYSGNNAGIGDPQLRLTFIWRNEAGHRELYPSTNITLTSISATAPVTSYIVASKYKLSLPNNTSFTNALYLDTIGALHSNTSSYCRAGACDRSINTNQIPVYSMILGSNNLKWKASDVYSGSDGSLYVTHNNWTTGTKLKSYVISSDGYGYMLSSYYDEQLKAIGSGIIGNHEVLGESRLVLGAGVYSYVSSFTGGGGGTNLWYSVSSYKPLPGNMTYQCRTFTNLNSAIDWSNTDF
jgi:hypothetical protein